MKQLIATAIFTLILATTAQATQNLYVQSKTAKIMASPTFNSGVVGRVNRGETLKVIETTEGWYKIEVGSINGWVNRLNVTKEMPKERISIVKESDQTISEEARRRSSALTSAVSARGLSEKERERASSQNDPDYPALEKLEDEAKSIPEKKVEKFNNPQK